jgi:hypothetical protein
VERDKGNNKVMRGKTYSLFGSHTSTRLYYATARHIVDELSLECPDAGKLLCYLRKAGKARSLFQKRFRKDHDAAFIAIIRRKAGDMLSEYTTGVSDHLRTLSFSQRFEETLRTTEEQYHLFMLEIELTNRMYRDAFKRSRYKFSLLPHCLRDFRPECKSVPGDIESICKGCTRDCFVNLGRIALEKHGVKPYISTTIDQDKLFRKLKADHPSIGALGIACIPELARGMRLCIKLGIPPLGIPLDANRCARWMKKTRESSFSLRELEALLT